MDRRHLSCLATVLAVIGFSCQTTTKDNYSYKVADGASHSYLDSELERLKQRSREYPKVADYHYEIAAIHFERESYKDSAVALRRAIAVEPVESRYHYQLGRVYLNMREMRRAEDAFRQAVRLTREERYSGPRAALAYVLALKKDIPGAIRHFKRCTEIEPDNPEFYYFLGALYDMRRDRDNAVRYFREYLDRGGSRFRAKAIDILGKLGIVVEENALRDPIDPVPEEPGAGLPPGLEGTFPPFRPQDTQGSTTGAAPR